MAMRQIIEGIFAEIWREDHDGTPPPLSDNTVLVETGLDSMAYAVLVARLDEELEIDPFCDATEAFYPVNFGEFVEFYEKHAKPRLIHDLPA
jgi:acyl carrier protein